MQNEKSFRIRELTETLNKYRAAYYYTDAPLVSDAVYDRLFDELSALETETGLQMANSPTQTTGYPVVSSLPKARHEIPLLSLDKTKSTGDLATFAGGRAIMLMLKLDGLTTELEYDAGSLMRVSTRGDGHEGEDITHNATGIIGVPLQIPYHGRLVVTGESYISTNDFDDLNSVLVDSQGEPFKNARNMAAGAVRNHDSSECARRMVRFTAFSALAGLDDIEGYSDSKHRRLNKLADIGFNICPQVLIEDPREDIIIREIESLKHISEMASAPIDGIVATYDDVAYSKSCGRTGHHYKDGLALKFEDDALETVFRGIEWTPSRGGELAPVALFDTVQIDGCDVSRASLHNMSFIRELELRPGCRILVSKRNMIIPYVEDNLDRGAFDDGLIPSTCPSCGARVYHSGRVNQKGRHIFVIRCDNPTCAKRKLRRFVHFVSKKAMDIEGLSEATLDRFIEQGWLGTYMDLYRLWHHEATICTAMPGFGLKSWKRLWSSIEKSMNTTFERYVISMDIPMVGRSASKELCRAFSGSLLSFETAVDNGFDFTTLPDFGETLHNNIHEWFRNEENRNTWEELQKMLNIQNGTTMQEAGQDNPFAGKTVVVTGKLEMFTRNSINVKIEELGAKAGSAVSKNTDYLICGEKAGSKLAKARELGITVLSEEQFMEMASA